MSGKCYLQGNQKLCASGFYTFECTLYFVRIPQKCVSMPNDSFAVHSLGLFIHAKF